jgi:ubiquinone biosynthesis protein
MAVSEGVGRSLNPNVNIWQVAQPLVEVWIRDHLGPEAQIRRVVGEGVSMLRALPSLIGRLERLADDLQRRNDRYQSDSAARNGRLWLVALAALAAGLMIAKAL